MTASGGYVYVIGLNNGMVKVGRSQDAATRLGTHKANARSLGLTVTDTWVSPFHAEWQPNEDALKKIATDLGGIPEGREAFSGIEFAAVVAKAEELSFTEPAANLPAPSSPIRREHPPLVENGHLLEGGCLTPSERYLVLAALEVAATMPPESLAWAGEEGTAVVAALLGARQGMLVDDLAGSSSEMCAEMYRNLHALVRFECSLSLLLARKKSAIEQENATYRLRRAQEIYGPFASGFERGEKAA